MKNHWYNKNIGLLVIALSLSLSACTDSASTEDGNNPAALPDTGSGAADPGESLADGNSGGDIADDTGSDVQSGYPFAAESSDIHPRRALYDQDGYGTVDVIRIDLKTVTSPGVCQAGEYAGCTLADVIADVDRKDDVSVRIPVHFSSTDFALDGTVVNAELSQRGGTTRKADQKSFKVKLADKDNLWRGERSILLNKHPYESTRIRNKLAFDLMSEIPHLMSSRTQFANLWIDDGEGPVDYGLFTHVENPGSNYLDKRGLNRDDRLYKVGYFRFGLNDLRNVQLKADGKPVDKDLFETSLEIEGGDDHRPLVAMLTALHDPERSFDSVLDQYFNRNNVLTWMAVNLLMHQTDAVTHNFILYNPIDSERFYFLPWDYDGGFVLESEPSINGMSNIDLQKRLYYGYARGINSEFHKRYYRLPGIHQRMLDAAQYLRDNYLTDSNVTEKAQRYESVVEPFVTRLPDIEFNPTYNEYTVEGLPRTIGDNLEALRTRFSIPMPPILDDPIIKDGQWEFAWEPAVELTGNRISYELQVSSSVGFEPDTIVLHHVGIDDNSDHIRHRVDLQDIPAGQHFARVIARASNEPERFWQVPKNYYRDTNGETWFGMQAFDVQ